MNEPISKKKHSLIKMCAHVLSLGQDVIITDDHVESLTSIMSDHLSNNLSPSKIAKLYNLDYSDFGMFLKTSLGLKLKPVSEANKIYAIHSGIAITDEKKKYQKQCRFRFNIYQYPDMLGYPSLLQYGVYNKNNVTGVSRDHMFSVEEGWRLQVDPTIISHPANCHLITQSDNSIKGISSSITLSQLMIRINQWDSNPINDITLHIRQLPKTDEHKRKLREANLLLMTITNGSSNLRIPKTDPIPSGFWRGMTRKSKMVGSKGLEPL